MKGMILAAGLGSRLRPLTDNLPKALVEIDGKTMLERVILNLKHFGVNEIVVNIHHLGQMIVDFLDSRELGVKIQISDETDYLLDTGGGLVKASDKLFVNELDFVIVHNVDILGNARIDELKQSHLKGGNDVTLLISNRDSSRKLLFDYYLQLKGWRNLKTDEYRPDDCLKSQCKNEYAFSGIYIINRRAIKEMEQLLGHGKYSVMDYFLHRERKSKIGGFLQEDLKLLDIGKPTTLSQASELLRDKNIFPTDLC